jgi:Lytic polysaccharide mono-oxygenase, cellulose-degrading
MLKQLLVSLILLLPALIQLASGHGRLIQPPSRASAWRFGFPTPPNWDDNELFCGGFDIQWLENDGQCGICGDDYRLPVPRPNEHGGEFGLGVITGTYSAGETIRLQVELTAAHEG